MTSAVLFMVGGLATLVVGGELLVRGASRMASLFGISPLVIGLTVVAFGTSSPELAVSLKASLGGQTDIAVGNVIGSNIFNVLFILGVSALVTPLIVSSQLIRVDVPMMIGVSVALLIVGLDGNIGRIEGIVLVVALACYTGWLVRQSRSEAVLVQKEYEQAYGHASGRSGAQLGLHVFLIIAGLLLLTLGAKWLVDGAVLIAKHFGMSELLIGLTIVAVGTSLPEVAASVMASIKGERDIAVGNIVGSNIFNIMCVLGISATVAPGGLEVSPTALRLDMPIMVAVAVACLPVFLTGHVISRWEGGVFVAYYVAYMVHLVLAATNAAVGRTFGGMMLGFVVPLTVLTLVIGVARARKSAAPSKAESDP